MSKGKAYKGSAEISNPDLRGGALNCISLWPVRVDRGLITGCAHGGEGSGFPEKILYILIYEYIYLNI